MKKKFLIAVVFSFLVTSGFAQISGTVKDQSGNPLQFALVCDANNVSNFAKTNENGEYRLSQGNSNTKLRVGALHMETIKSTSARNIVMSPDALLDTDEYHISFDHLRPGDSYSNKELRTDFPVTYSKGLVTNEGEIGTANDRTSIDYDKSIDPGGVSLKVKFPEQAVKTSDSGIDLRIPLMNTFKDNFYESYDLYLSYWIRFDDNFDFSLCGGKLPSLGGTTRNTEDMDREDMNQNAWKGRIMWRKGGSIQFYMELPENGFTPTNEERFWGQLETEGEDLPGVPAICEFEYTNYLKAPGWHNIELHYKFETPGQNDGYFEGWVDGQHHDIMEAEVFNNYREPGTIREDLTINRLLISAFFGGSDLDDYSPGEGKGPLYIWFDEFRVSKTRINEWDRYMGTLSVNENQTQNINSAYPNPSTGLFTLSKSANWEIFDLLGKTIKSGAGEKIDIQGHPKGMYFLKTDTADTVSKLMLK